MKRDLEGDCNQMRDYADLLIRFDPRRPGLSRTQRRVLEAATEHVRQWQAKLWAEMNAHHHHHHPTRKA